MDLALYKAAQPFSQKHLLTLQDWSEDEILQCLSLAVKADLSGRKDACNDFCKIVYAHACFF